MFYSGSCFVRTKSHFLKTETNEPRTNLEQSRVKNSDTRQNQSKPVNRFISRYLFQAPSNLPLPVKYIHDVKPMKRLYNLAPSITQTGHG